MNTPKGEQVVKSINELNENFKSYLQRLFDDWKSTVSDTINEKIKYPLFKINDNKTIDINFAKEVTYFFTSINV